MSEPRQKWFLAPPKKLAEFRRAYEALVAEYYSDNLVRQGYLLTRATKI